MPTSVSVKPWQSKTIWINALLGMFAALALFFPSVGGIGAWLAGNSAVIGIGWSLLNIGVRAVTKNAVSLVD